MLLTLGIFTVVGVIILVIGIILANGYDYTVAGESMVILSMLGLVGLGIFGFGVAACEHETMIVETIQPDTILRTKKIVLVEFVDDRKIYESHSDYININDKTIWYKIQFYNYYNDEEDIIYSKDKMYSNCKIGEKILAKE